MSQYSERERSDIKKLGSGYPKPPVGAKDHHFYIDKDLPEAGETSEVFHDPFGQLVDQRSPEQRDSRIEGWIKEENETTDRIMAENVPEALQPQAFQAEMERLYQPQMYSNTIVVGKPGERLFFYEVRQPGKTEDPLYYKRERDGQEILIFDPNKPDIGKKFPEKTAISTWHPSPDGKHLAINLKIGGIENNVELYIIDLETGKPLPETIERLRYGGLQWLPDSSGFYYARCPKVGDSVEAIVDGEDQSFIIKDPAQLIEGEKLKPQESDQAWERAYLHKLGTDQDSDTRITSIDRPFGDSVAFTSSRDERYTGVYLAADFQKGADVLLHNYKESEPEKQWTKLFEGKNEYQFEFRVIADKVMVATNWGAANGRVIWAPLDKLPPVNAIEQWQELVPENKDNILVPHMTRGSMEVVGDRLLIKYLRNACAYVETYDFEGNRKAVKDLADTGETITNGSVGHSRPFLYTGEPQGKEIFFTTSGLTTPGKTYKYNAESDTFEVYREFENPPGWDMKKFGVSRETINMPDGRPVQFFVLKRNDVELNENTPVVMHGYGFSGIVTSPKFRYFEQFAPIIDRGVAFVLANLSGGGEFGPSFQEQGSGANKLNTRDEFVAIVEHLIANKQTSPKKLGLYGESNGGWTVTATAAARPDLFGPGALVAQVPVIDAGSYDQHPISFFWASDYGSLKDPETVARLRESSGYEYLANAVNDGRSVDYPSALYLPGWTDSRVGYFDAARMAAAQQQLQADNPEKVALLYTNMKTGHGMSSVADKIGQEAQINSFFAWRLGLETK
jgi:prolyl oligopeptidase